MKKLRAMWSEDVRVIIPHDKMTGLRIEWGTCSVAARWARLFERRTQAFYNHLRSDILKYLKKTRRVENIEITPCSQRF